MKKRLIILALAFAGCGRPNPDCKEKEYALNRIRFNAASSKMNGLILLYREARDADHEDHLSLLAECRKMTDSVRFYYAAMYLASDTVLLPPQIDVP